MLSLENFRYIVSDDVLAEIYARARGLYGKHIVHINSTYQGGGVAEILSSLVLLMNTSIRCLVDIALPGGLTGRVYHGNAFWRGAQFCRIEQRCFPHPAVGA